MTRADPSRRVALISSDVPTRGALAAYLTEAGFAVHECAELAVAAAFAALVVLAEHEHPDELVAEVRGWLRTARPQRLVVVTARPSALKQLALAHAGRLIVLPAPAFSWDLVDALRATTPDGSRGA